jgi:hypothetical protein
MMNRRDALLAISASVLGGIRPLQPAWVQLFQSAVIGGQAAQPPATSVQDAVDDRLRKDIARLGPREYSEEGIPVFLACENLAASKNASVKLTAFNAALAAEFRKNAAAWQRIKPDAPDADVAKLIEVLAERDFSNGGKELKQ